MDKKNMSHKWTSGILCAAPRVPLLYRYTDSFSLLEDSMISLFPYEVEGIPSFLFNSSFSCRNSYLNLIYPQLQKAQGGKWRRDHTYYVFWSRTAAAAVSVVTIRDRHFSSVFFLLEKFPTGIQCHYHYFTFPLQPCSCCVYIRPQ